jgi:hypothetical protein
MANLENILEKHGVYVDCFEVVDDLYESSEDEDTEDTEDDPPPTRKVITYDETEPKKKRRKVLEMTATVENVLVDTDVDSDDD